MTILLLFLLWGFPISTLADQGIVMLLVGGFNPSDAHLKPSGYYESEQEKVAEIFDPNGIITCTLNNPFSDSNSEDQNPQYSTLNYLPNTRELLLCGGQEHDLMGGPDPYMGKCLVLNNKKFFEHSNLTQQHLNHHHTAVVNGKLWLFGGDMWHKKEGYLIESLDGATWSVEDAPRTPTPHDTGSCSVYTKDALILIGGASQIQFLQDPIPSANVSKLIPGSNHWESLAPLPAPREDHGCIYLPPSLGFPEGSILVAGGTTGRTCDTCFSDSLIYNISKNIWIPAGEMEVSHARGSLVEVDGRILFAGGLSACKEQYCKENPCKRKYNSYGPVQYWCEKLGQDLQEKFCNKTWLSQNAGTELVSTQYGWKKIKRKPLHYWCNRIGHTYRVDEFHLENLGTEKPTWMELEYKLKSPRAYGAAAAIPIEYWNNGKSCRISNPLPTAPPTTTSTTTTNVDCFDEDNDYPGMDINLSTAKTTDRKATAAECQALCNIKEECNFFTWSSTNNRCYLKHAKSGVNHEEGAISGPKIC